MTLERRFGWIHRAHALDKLGRTLEAKDLLLSVVDDLESNSTIPYHLAQYCVRLVPFHGVNSALLTPARVTRQKLADLLCYGYGGSR